MRLSFLALSSALLFSYEAAAANRDAINAFKRVEKQTSAREKRTATPCPGPSMSSTQASPYLNNVTE
ncbi:hypothetical protein LTS18_013397, partial [Coniosporium uncinatum]